MAGIAADLVRTHDVVVQRDYVPSVLQNVRRRDAAGRIVLRLLQLLVGPQIFVIAYLVADSAAAVNSRRLQYVRFLVMSGRFVPGSSAASRRFGVR